MCGCAGEEADYAFLRTLYREVRAAELAPVPWSERAQKHAFCDSQFAAGPALPRRALRTQRVFVIEQAGLPVGRLYLNPRTRAIKG